MLRRMAEWGDPQQTRLFFGLTHYTEIFAQDELRELAESMPDFGPTPWSGNQIHGGQAPRATPSISPRPKCKCSTKAPMSMCADPRP